VGSATGRSLPTKTAVLLALAISLSLVSASSASATASYNFEPTLSLTGNCKTSPLDEVPDPGLCPIPPGEPGKDHPSASFKNPSVTTDAYGDIYVISGEEEARKIDVFDPEGFFITEFADPGNPSSIAVDSKGNVYVFDQSAEGERQVRRFPPTAYEPGKGILKYEESPVVVISEKTFGFLGFVTSVAVDAKDFLYVDHVQAVSIFTSAEEGSGLLKKEAISGLSRSTSIAVDSVHKKIYVSDKIPGSSVVRVFKSEPPYEELKEEEIDGSTTPAKAFVSLEGFLGLDVDDPAGHVFVGDFTASKVYEFEEDGTYLATIEQSFERVPSGELAVDDGPFSPHPQEEGWLFVPSGPAPTQGHVYAFEPNEERPPKVEKASVGDVTETEATLRATINPGGALTEYRLEYISLQQYKEEGESFANAVIAGEGTLKKGAEGVAVSATAAGLEPGTAYLFHVFAQNTKGKDEARRAFKTFEEEAALVPPGGCSNEALRTGPSLLLPDCRAYELVTPSSTNGRPPSGGFNGYTFPVQRSTADGSRLSFLIEGGSLPGGESAGSFHGDPFLAIRGSAGWGSTSAGPSGKEAINPAQAGLSSDQAYSFWQGAGEAALHIRYPDGHSELVGRGSLGEDSNVSLERALITEGANHIVFATNGGTAVHLEPDAPPAGTGAVYDRSAEGPTRVVSLLPGDVTPGAKEDATYLGASEEGEGIAFSIKGTIYLRLHNAATFKVAGPGTTFAGVADEGKRVFYLEGGDLFAFDAEREETIPFSSSGNVTPVNVATGGTRAYFVSPSVLTGEKEPNPNGEIAKPGAEGEQNLYLSEEGAISFVGVVTKTDVEGAGGGGLGSWIQALRFPAGDPSRTTTSGSTLLFESRADLTGFESGGFIQVYRYDSGQGRLDCLSCSPTGTPPTSDASLQSIQAEQFSPEPAGSQMKITNQSPDGKRAFFQTAEPLVVGDTDEQLDVYEWEEEGVGSCKKEGGCVYLISGRRSSNPDYLFAMSASGDDVFFRTADLLLPRDAENTLSIYDARVGGGFPESSKEIPCRGTDTCQPAPTPPPSQPQPTTSVVGPDGNLPPKRHCPKGKRAVEQGGKTTCVKKHRKHGHHHRRAGAKKRGGSR
jgi:hypothetical protein